MLYPIYFENIGFIGVFVQLYEVCNIGIIGIKGFLGDNEKNPKTIPMMGFVLGSCCVWYHRSNYWAIDEYVSWGFSLPLRN